VNSWVKPNLVDSSTKTSFSKCLPWSETSCRGTSKWEMTWLKKKCVVVLDVLLNVGIASSHLVKYSMTTMMYLCPLLDGGLHIMKLMPHLQKGPAVMTRCRREGGARALCAYN
jgi:hypothetical protein